ncbi:MAG: alpha/beta fold hydrolase [Actinomycetia bacterium]|nr:alpha/beta fold hydrolase [Actinomycetes bacterium]
MLIPVRGVRLNVEVTGVGSPLVLLHGLGGEVGHWAPQIEAFRAGHQVVALDLRGFGRSDRTRGAMSLADFADDVADVLVALGLGPSVVVGASMGGIISQELVLRRPELVAGLVLADTTSDLSEGHRQQNEALRTVALDQGMDAIAPALVRGCFTRATMDAADSPVAEFERGIRATDPWSFAIGIRAIVGMDLGPRIADIRVPTAVVWGVEDALAADCEVIAATIPQAERHPLAAAGHAANLEQPGAFNAAVRALVARVAATEAR